jgi:hypothetical protein
MKMLTMSRGKKKLSRLRSIRRRSGRRIMLMMICLIRTMMKRLITRTEGRISWMILCEHYNLLSDVELL